MITLVQSDPEVPPGTIAEWLKINLIPYRIIRVYSKEALPSIDSSSVSIILGGSMGVHDFGRFPFLASVKSYVMEAAACDSPLLGICLGGQLLADALGARVHSGRYGEKGVRTISLLGPAAEDSLFSGLPGEVTTFQWHDDSFDLPDGAVPLATSTACPNQAFRYGSHLYGLQFHPEVNVDIVSLWSGGSPDASGSSPVLEDFKREEEAYRSDSRTLLENFLRIAGMIART